MTRADDRVACAHAVTVGDVEHDVVGARLDALYQRLRERARPALLSGIVEEPARQPDGIDRRGIRRVQRAAPARAVAQHQVITSQEAGRARRGLSRTGGRPASMGGLGTQQCPPPTDSRNPGGARASPISSQMREQSSCQRRNARPIAAAPPANGGTTPRMHARFHTAVKLLQPG